MCVSRGQYPRQISQGARSSDGVNSPAAEFPGEEKDGVGGGRGRPRGRLPAPSKHVIKKDNYLP